MVSARVQRKPPKRAVSMHVAAHLIYVEVGGASQQIVFTIPAQPNVHPPTTPTSFLESESETDLNAQVNAEANVQAETEAAEQLVARVESGAYLDAEADTSVMATTDGPMHLKATRFLPEHGLLYSKSFLGNGMNRMTRAVVNLALEDAEQLHCGLQTQTPCIDMPCWRTGSILGYRPGSKDIGWLVDGADPKVVQDLTDENLPLLEWIQPAKFQTGVFQGLYRTIVGTNDRVKCLKLVRRVWAGSDEHLQAYPYAQQFTEVRAALGLATGGHAKTHIMLSTKTIALPDMTDAKSGWRDGFSVDRANNLPTNAFRSWLKKVYTTRPMSQFTYHTPLIAAYFESILFDVNTFNLNAHCPPNACTVGAWGVDWSVGAADFFAALNAFPNTQRSEDRKNEYKAWKFKTDRTHNPGTGTHPDLEDPFYGVCAERLDPTATIKVAAAKAICEGYKNANGQTCKFGLMANGNGQVMQPGGLAAVIRTSNPDCVAWGLDTNAHRASGACVCYA